MLRGSKALKIFAKFIYLMSLAASRIELMVDDEVQLNAGRAIAFSLQ